MADRNEETGMVLVATLIGELQKTVLKAVADIGELKGTLDAVHGEVRFTNGKVKTLRADLDELVTWRDGFQDEGEQAAAYAAGRKSVRDGDRALAKRLLSWMGHRWPFAILAVLSGFGAQLGAWLIGHEWAVPW